MSKWIKSLLAVSIVLSNLLPAQRVFAEDTIIEENTMNESNTPLNVEEASVMEQALDSEEIINEQDLIDNTESTALDNETENKSDVLNISDLALTSETLSEQRPITFSMITDNEETEGNIVLVFRSKNTDLEILVDMYTDGNSKSYSNTLYLDQDYPTGTYTLSKILVDDIKTETTGIVFEDVIFNIEFEQDNIVQISEVDTTNNIIDEVDEEITIETESIPEQEVISSEAETTLPENTTEIDQGAKEIQTESSSVFTKDSISLNQTEFTRGDTLKVEVDLEANGIQNIEVGFKSEDQYNFTITLTHDYYTNVFSGKNLVGDDLYSGNYHISHTIITYYDGTIEQHWDERDYYYDADSSIDLSDFDFTIKNTFRRQNYTYSLLSNVGVSSEFVEKGDLQQVTMNKHFDNDIKSIKVNLLDTENSGNSHTVDSEFTVKENQVFLEFEIDEVLAEDRWKIDSFTLVVEYLAEENQGRTEYRNYQLYYEEYADVTYHFLGTAKPLINIANEVIINVGDSFDIYDYLTVTDLVDGDITHQAEIELNNFSASKRGEYWGTITVKNSQGVTSEQRLTIRVKDPQITGIDFSSQGNRRVLNIGDELFLDSIETKLKTIDIDEEIVTNPAWFSKDTSILEIDENNKATAVSPGLTYLFVKSHGQVTGMLVQVNSDKALFPEKLSGVKTLFNKTYADDLYIDSYASIVLNNVTVEGDIYVDGKLELINSTIHGNIYSDRHEPLDIKTENEEISYTYYDDKTVFFELLEFNRDGFYNIFPDDQLFAIGDELYFGGYFMRKLYKRPFDNWSNIDGLYFEKIDISEIDIFALYHKPPYNNHPFETYRFPFKSLELSDNGNLNTTPKLEKTYNPETEYGEQGNILAQLGSEIDYSKYVKAFDVEDGDITDKIEVDDENVNYDKEGIYTAKLSVTDTAGATSTMEVEVQVVEFDFYFTEDVISIYTEGQMYIGNLLVNTLTNTNHHLELSSADPDIVSIEGYNIFGRSIGETTLTAKLGGIEKHIQVKVKPFVQYKTHIQSYGWDYFVRDGVTRGTVGQAKRLEGIIIDMPNTSEYGNIEYRTHVEKYGWMDWEQNGEMSGTEGEAKRLEAIQIRLTDELAERYDIYYRVHAQSYGWLDWAKNGEEAGTAGLGKRLEGIEVQLVEKGEQAPGSTDKAYVDGNVKPVKVPSVSYTTHVQSYGWQDTVKDGDMSGTSGEAKRLESIKIDLENQTYAGDVAYTTHVQSYGWQDPVRNGEMSGTSGEAKRLEAIRIALAGELAEQYDVYYRVHAQSYGWLGWAKNGASSGTEGLAKRLEGIEIKLVKKGEQAPGSTDKSFIK